MDALSIYSTVKIGIFVFAILIAMASLILTWRIRGLFHWKRSLRKELAFLRKTRETAEAPRRQAIDIVLAQCQTAWDAALPELNSLDDAYCYLRDIASCFHPQRDMPELEISVKQLLSTARDIAGRLEQIMNRPGIKRLRNVRIRHIRKSYAQYERYRKSRLVYIFNRYIKNIYRLHWVMLGDPLSLVVFFSNRFTVLAISRCLLVDLYLYFGTLAIEAYASPTNLNGGENTEERLENTLQDLDAISVPKPTIEDPRIREIRSQMVGVPAILTNPPRIVDLKDAIKKTAALTAENYFPDAEKPLDEIAVGPLLERSHMWITTLCETEKIKGVSVFYSTRLASFVAVKSFSDRFLPPQIRMLAKNSWRLYRWARYPYKFYRIIRKTTPLAISLQAGWILAERAALRFIYRYVFDMAYREMDIICKESKMLPENPMRKKRRQPVEVVSAGLETPETPDQFKE